MYGAALLTLLLIGPPGLTSDPRPVSEPGMGLVFIMSMLAALTLGVILGRWIYQPSPEADPPILRDLHEERNHDKTPLANH